MSKPRYTAVESQLTISPSKRSASAIPSALFPVAVGLIDFNPSVQRFHLERCRRYLDLCFELEAKNLLLVLGEYIWERQVIPPAEQWATGVKNLRELGKYAADLNLQIALELEPFKLSLVNDVDSMVRFLDEVNHPAVRANIDVSHLQLSRVRPEELRRRFSTSGRAEAPRRRSRPSILMGSVASFTTRAAPSTAPSSPASSMMRYCRISPALPEAGSSAASASVRSTRVRWRSPWRNRF